METKKKITKPRRSAAPKKPRAEKKSAAVNGSIPLFNAAGKETGRIELNTKLFNGDVNKGVLYQVICMYQANQRRGTAATKTRGDVSGGGKKPWRQKGTGRARAGSTRSPLWRHGGIIFGPHPRDFHYQVPKKIIRLALLSSLNAKLNEGKMLGIESMAIDQPKTKKVQSIIDALKLQGRCLFVVDEITPNLKLATRNIPDATVRHYRDFNALDVLHSNTVVISKASLEKLAERFVA